MKMSTTTINFVNSHFMGIDWIRRQVVGSYAPIIKCNVPTLKERVQAHKWFYGCGDVNYIGIILRHDQKKDVEYRIREEMNNEYVKTELIHKSPDFTNLGYVGDVDGGEGANNYLNFYIYKVTYNV